MRTPAIVLLLAHVLSCKPAAPTIDPAFEPAAAKVKAHLSKLSRIKQAVDATPRLSADTLALPGGQKASSTIVTVDQLTNLGACFSDAEICNEFWWRLSACERGANLTPAEATAQFDAVNDVKRCAGLKYVAVARKRAFTLPSVDKASKTYHPGHLSVELLVFDLETKTPQSLEGMSPQTNVEKYLQEVLGRHVFDAMRARIDG